MKTYRGAHRDTTLQILVRYAVSLSKVQKGNKTSRSLRNKHSDTRRLQKHLITYTRREEGSPVMNITWRRSSVSSSSSSSSNRKATKRSDCSKSRNLGPSRQQINRLDVAPVLTEVPKRLGTVVLPQQRTTQGVTVVSALTSHKCRKYAPSYHQTFEWPYHRRGTQKRQGPLGINLMALWIETGSSTEAQSGVRNIMYVHNHRRTFNKTLVRSLTSRALPRKGSH